MNISYKDGWWWPDYEPDPVKCLSFVMKSIKDSDLALPFCRGRRVCVQAGGHIGLWPIRLSMSFAKVYTFECEPNLTECIRRNAVGIDNIVISDKALGAFIGEVAMRAAVSAGGWNINVAGRHKADQTTIDAMGLEFCDALFLDVEAYEVEALKGATETIARCNPVIMVEELPRSKEAINAHLLSLGYETKAKVHGDVIYAR